MSRAVSRGLALLSALLVPPHARTASSVALLSAVLLSPHARATSQESRSVPAAAAAEDSILEARTRAIAAVLRCPVCQGESIQDSPAELAQQMRAVVREQLREGRTPEEIKAYFAARYGEWILLEPKMTGLNVLLYLFPVLLIAGGLAGLFVAVRRWTSQPQAAAAPEPRPVE